MTDSNNPTPPNRGHITASTEPGALQILAHHTTGASNGPVKAANLLIKQVKRSDREFRNAANYRLRILLAGGTNPACKTQPVTSIRPRRPRLVA